MSRRAPLARGYQNTASGTCGRLFSNVRLNQRLAETLPVDEIFVFPAMGDDGLAVGSALCFLRERDGLATWLGQRRRLDDVYLGRDYGQQIDACLSGADGVQRKNGAVAQATVDLIRAGKVGAIYTGRMEYGPRALGDRSILASPCDPAINDVLNKRLDRSEFMPFAPYVLEEDAERVFEITPCNRYAARFMTITCDVRPAWHNQIPAVVHIDGSARPQVIEAAWTTRFYYEVVEHFYKRTALPVLVNTSFNVHEEPIIDTPGRVPAGLHRRPRRLRGDTTGRLYARLNGLLEQGSAENRRSGRVRDDLGLAILDACPYFALRSITRI